MDFTEEKFEYQGVSTHYFVKGTGTPVLFLSGGGVSVRVYEKILSALAKKYQVIAPDLPCLGNGTVPREVWGLSEYGDFFLEFSRVLKMKDFIVIGHSLGGGIGLALAAKSQDVKRLVIIDSAGKVDDKSEFRLRYNFFVLRTLYDFFGYKDKSAFFSTTQSFLVNRFNKCFKWRQIVRILRKCLFVGFNDFKSVKIPTLILWGDKDEVFPLETAKEMNREIVNSKLKIVNGNHDWSLFRPNEFLTLFEEWIGK